MNCCTAALSDMNFIVNRKWILRHITLHHTNCVVHIRRFFGACTPLFWMQYNVCTLYDDTRISVILWYNVYIITWNHSHTIIYLDTNLRNHTRWKCIIVQFYVKANEWTRVCKLYAFWKKTRCCEIHIYGWTWVCKMFHTKCACLWTHMDCWMCVYKMCHALWTGTSFCDIRAYCWTCVVKCYMCSENRAGFCEFTWMVERVFVNCYTRSENDTSLCEIHMNGWTRAIYINKLWIKISNCIFHVC